MTRRLFSLTLLIAGLAMTALAACAESPEPTATPVDFEPTAAGEQPTQPAATPTSGAGPAATPTQASGGGDASRGEQLFASNGCSGCHSTGSDDLVGPGLAGVGERAATRTDLSADEYLHQSIVDPGAFVVDGFSNLMPGTFSSLPDQDIDDLVAYLKTLE